MKKDLYLWQFAGFSLSTLFGTLLHFMYDWTNESLFIAPFSGVNESTWEHMKLLFFPLFIFALVQSRFFKEYQGFWCIKLYGTLAGLISIPVLFYTYNGVIGKSPDWVNISIFFISAGITFLLETKLFLKTKTSCKFKALAFLSLCLIGVLFIIFTFKTPQIAVFRDPVTGLYGMNS